MFRSLSNAVIEGSMNSNPLSGSSFDGILDIPINHQFGKLTIPIGITPFSQRERVPKHKEMIGFNKCDILLATSLSTSYSYVDELVKHMKYGVEKKKFICQTIKLDFEMIIIMDNE